MRDSLSLNVNFGWKWIFSHPGDEALIKQSGTKFSFCSKSQRKGSCHICSQNCRNFALVLFTSIAESHFPVEACPLSPSSITERISESGEVHSGLGRTDERLKLVTTDLGANLVSETMNFSDRPTGDGSDRSGLLAVGMCFQRD